MNGTEWRRTPLLVCTGLAVGGHLMLAVLGGRGSGSAVAAPPGALTVRTVLAEPVAPVQAPLADAAEPAELKAERLARKEGLEAAPPVAAVASQPEPALLIRFDEADYLPRRELTVAPVLKAEVPLVWPEEGVLAGRYSAVVTLFVDETGRVRKLRFDGDGLPPLLQEQAREAFLGARFSPGELQGVPVKSRVRVEVVFEAPGFVRRGGSGL